MLNHYDLIFPSIKDFNAKAPVISGGCCLPINKIYGFSKSFPIKILLIERPSEVLPNSEIVTFLISLIILYQFSYQTDDNISWAEIMYSHLLLALKVRVTFFPLSSILIIISSIFFQLIRSLLTLGWYLCSNFSYNNST